MKRISNPKDKKGIWNEFLLNEEEDYAGFLGIDISKSKDNPKIIKLLQTGLIDRIVNIVLRDKELVSNEPAKSISLGKDEHGDPRKFTWNYGSVIGMLLYLSSNSRPDIAFAVNQAARFTHCACHSHETAIIRIAKYLKKTRDNGLHINPHNEFNLELHADANFAGLWNIENPDDAICAKSGTGYILTLGGIPVTWSSKLQTEIATSTMHAEYITLSTGMRELLPVNNTLCHICKTFQLKRTKEAKIVKAWEDNEGALKLASSPLVKVTPHSKHFAIKYHWFREKLTEANVVIKRVDTKFQRADIFTKGLVGNEFSSKRKLLMGW